MEKTNKKHILATILIFLFIILLSSPVNAQPSCVDAPNNLISWWTLDETSGLVAEDIGGSNNDGTRILS